MKMRNVMELCLRTAHCSGFACVKAAVVALLVLTFCTRGSAQSPASDSTEEEERDAYGFLFVNGRYVAPPYDFQSVDGQISVNGLPVDLKSAGAEKEKEKQRDKETGRRSRGERRRNAQPQREPWRELVEELETGTTIVLFPDEPMTMYSMCDDYELLSVLSDGDARKVAARDGVPWMPSTSNPETWKAWFASFEPSPDFLTRARTIIERCDAVVAETDAKTSATRRLEKSAYPLTLAGMVLVVLALGHLLAHRPAPEDDAAANAILTTEGKRFVRRSLTLVVGLSALDLIWTLLVSQAGVMKELNPLGSRLVDDPQQLILFKLAATSVGVGLLYALQRHRLAQQASWWACLVCTLLVVRWLTFNSMFVS